MDELSLPLPSRDSVRIAHAYAPQFEASEAFLSVLWTSLPQRSSDTFALALMNVLGRSLSTYRGLLHLLRGGFADQAQMLNRPLFEDMVFGFWIALPENRSSAVEIVAEHEARVQERIDYLLERLDTDGLEGVVQRGDPVKDWTGRDLLVRGLDKRVDQINDLWIESGGTLEELYVHREISHWFSNLEMHTSGSSVR